MGYPRKKQSFYKEKDCFFFGYPNFFGPSYFEAALVYKGKFFMDLFFHDKYLDLIKIQLDNSLLVFKVSSVSYVGVLVHV